MILKIHNNYTYIDGEVPYQVKNACSVEQKYVINRAFQLSNSVAKKEFSIYNFNSGALIKKAKALGYAFAIPLSLKRYYQRKSQNSVVLVPCYNTSYKYYFEDEYNRFPSGWLFYKVLPVLKKLEIKVKLIDCRNKITAQELPHELPFPLRYYQEECVNIAIQKERGILKLATGAGKSLIGAALMKHYGLPTLYIVPSLNLINQAYFDFRDIFGDLIGRVGDGIFEPSLITIATQQTLWSRIESEETNVLLNNTNVLILDEAHKVERADAKEEDLGNTWYKMALLFNNARIRIALTATPGQEGSYSKELLQAVTGKILYEKGTSELIREGFLVRPTVHLYTIKHEQEYDSWREAYKEGIQKNKERNEKIAAIADDFAKQGKKVLITIDKIKNHGIPIAELLPESATIFGEDKSKDRIEIFKRFESGEVPILITTTVKEGVNIPSMDVIIMAQGGKGGEGGRASIQRIGRVLRTHKEKDSAYIIDFIDKDNGILEKHSSQRIKIYKDEKEFKIKYKE